VSNVPVFLRPPYQVLALGWRRRRVKYPCLFIEPVRAVFAPVLTAIATLKKVFGSKYNIPILAVVEVVRVKFFLVPVIGHACVKN
jgi:hypothetical protein